MRRRRASGRAGLPAALLALTLGGGAALAQNVPLDDPPGALPFPLATVNGAAVIENSRAARALRETERDLRERVEAENTRVQAELEAEERDLLRLRETLPSADFEVRTAAFDRRVRAERRLAQERGALLLAFVQDARGALVSALPRVLEQVRREAGAAMLLDAGAVLAVDPALDLTAYAISRYDAELGGVRFDPPAALIDPAAVPPDLDRDLDLDSDSGEAPRGEPDDDPGRDPDRDPAVRPDGAASPAPSDP